MRQIRVAASAVPPRLSYQDNPAGPAEIGPLKPVIGGHKDWGRLAPTSLSRFIFRQTGELK